MQELNFKQIGQKLREVRLSQNLTQEYVANTVNINTSHISNIENNRVKISLTTLVAICNVLNTTVDYILSNEYVSSESAIDREIMHALQGRSNDEKEKILKIIQII